LLHGLEVVQYGFEEGFSATTAKLVFGFQKEVAKALPP
jgi:hypothetical protein